MEQKETLTIYPSGAGTIQLYQQLGEQLTGMITGFAPKDKQKETIEDTCYKDLANWQGVAAWAPVRAGLENGRVTCEATGYFDHVAALKKIEQGSSESFAWTSNPGGGFGLVWSSEKDSKQKPQFDDVSEERAHQMAQVGSMIEGLKVEHTAVLPGTIQTCAGCTGHRDRVASFVMTGDDLSKMLEMWQDYRKRIASKQITREKAEAEFAEKSKELSADLKITSASANVSREFEKFQTDYQKAKIDFAESGVAERIQRAGTH